MNAALQLDHPAPVLLTADDFMLLADAGAFESYGHTELLDGIIVFVNSQYVPHARAKSELAFHLRLALQDLGLELEVLVEGSVRLGSRDVPIPDISLCTPLTRARAPAPGQSLRLAVEVADTTLAHDLRLKAKLYARAGVPEYWVVDLSGDKLHRLTEPVGDRYERHETISIGEPMSALTIPGLTVPTDRLT